MGFYLFSRVPSDLSAGLAELELISCSALQSLPAGLGAMAAGLTRLDCQVLLLHSGLSNPVLEAGGGNACFPSPIISMWLRSERFAMPPHHCLLMLDGRGARCLQVSRS